jgi:hypothetical protein
MRIVLFTDQSDLAGWSALRGIRALIGPERRFIRSVLDYRNFPKAGIRQDDLVLVAGAGFLEERHAGFWRWLSGLRLVPLVLWGVSASQRGDGTPGVDPETIRKLRPRVLAANVGDDLTNELYGLRGHVSYSPAAVRLRRAVPVAGNEKILLASPRIRRGAGDLGPLLDLCDLMTSNAGILGPLGYPGMLSLYRRAGLVISTDVTGAVIAGALGIPCIPLSTDRSVSEFHRMYGCGNPARSVADAAAMVRSFLGHSLSIPVSRFDTARIGEFAEKFRKVVYDSLTPVDLGSCRIRG